MIINKKTYDLPFYTQRRRRSTKTRPPFLQISGIGLSCQRAKINTTGQIVMRLLIQVPNQGQT